MLSKGNSGFTPHTSSRFYISIAPLLTIPSRKPTVSFLIKNPQLEDPYLIFTLAIAAMAIGVEILLAKNARLLKRSHHSLSRNYNILMNQHADLQHTLYSLQESGEENSRRLQIIVHDLRSPIAAIVGLSGFMIDENKLADEDMEVINLIHTSGVDSLRFIHDILDKESAKMEMKKESVDLCELLTYCVAQFKHKAMDKFQCLKLESHANIKIKLDRDKIWRAINNLISNALKFSPPHSNIIIALNLSHGNAIISVKDFGIGIPASLGDKIFGCNDQRKREGTAGEKSFGMGLAIAKQHIEAHGGTLTFTSGHEKGTTFFIELPYE